MVVGPRPHVGRPFDTTIGIANYPSDMGANAVAGFLPSRHGFHFANRWPSTPALWWGAALIHLGFGDTARGLCGGMSFATKDCFDRGEVAPSDTATPGAGTPLFEEIVRRQMDSFDHLVVVPVRFWAMSMQGEAARQRSSVVDAWPSIRADIDAGRLAMVGLVRTAGRNPLATGLGHQVVGFRYDERADRVSIGIYDPNHPDADDVELRLERGPGGTVALSQTTGEPLLGLLHLPFVAARSA
jgi:hypothetical protein